MAVNTQQRVFWGLAGDAKPTKDPDDSSRPLGAGSRFYAVDTGAVYDWTGTAWIVSLISSGGGGGGGGATTVADGADVAEGATTDAIVAAGAAGTLSAKLRRATQGLEDLKTLISLAAGTNVVGKFTTDQTAPGTSDLVHAAQQGSWTVTTSPPANASTNITQVAGAAITQGHGTAATAIRVELPTDGTGVIAGVTTVATVTAVTAITNALPAGTNTIGNVGNVKGTKVNSTNAPTASAAQCLAANATRIKALFYNAGTQTVYLGATSGVTSSNGFPLPAGATLTDVSTTSAWYAITASGTGDLRIIEVS